MRIPTLFSAILVLSGLTAAAEVSADKMNAARAAITDYAQQMTDFLPCAYVAYSGSKGTEDFVETTYGLTAISETIGKFISAENGTLAQAAELAAVYAGTAKPVFERDVRELTKFCKDHKLIEALYLFKAEAMPLSLRAPFKPMN